MNKTNFKRSYDSDKKNNDKGGYDPKGEFHQLPDNDEIEMREAPFKGMYSRQEIRDGEVARARRNKNLAEMLKKLKDEFKNVKPAKE